MSDIIGTIQEREREKRERESEIERGKKEIAGVCARERYVIPLPSLSQRWLGCFSLQGLHFSRLLFLLIQIFFSTHHWSLHALFRLPAVANDGGS